MIPVGCIQSKKFINRLNFRTSQKKAIKFQFPFYMLSLLVYVDLVHVEQLSSTRMQRLEI